MIARFFRAILVREAARYLSQYHERQQRALIRKVTRQMRQDIGLPPNKALNG